MRHDLGYRSGVSPVTATLLLVAVTIGAAMTTYGFANQFPTVVPKSGGTVVSDQMSMMAYNFANTQQLTVYLEDTGASAVELSSVYYNGVPLTPTDLGAGTTCTQTFPSSCSEGQTLALLIVLGSASVNGTDQMIKTVTSDGAQFPYTVTAGNTG